MESTFDINFDTQEQAFIDKIMGSWQPASYDVYLDMVQAIMDKQILQGHHLLDVSVGNLVESIRYKIFDYRASVEIEKMLSDPSYRIRNAPRSPGKGQTKANSYKLTKREGKITALHLAILKSLKEEPSQSRRDLADSTGIRLQSVCARVRELIELGQVHTDGTKQDKETDRLVETLSRTSDAG